MLFVHLRSRSQNLVSVLSLHVEDSPVELLVFPAQCVIEGILDYSLGLRLMNFYFYFDTLDLIAEKLDVLPAPLQGCP